MKSLEKYISNKISSFKTGDQSYLRKKIFNVKCCVDNLSKEENSRKDCKNKIENFIKQKIENAVEKKKERIKSREPVNTEKPGPSQEGRTYEEKLSSNLGDASNEFTVRMLQKKKKKVNNAYNLIINL